MANVVGKSVAGLILRMLAIGLRLGSLVAR